VTDNLPKYDTVKYYKVELPSPGRVTLGFDHKNLESSAVFWKITMFDSLENIVLTYESRGTETAGKSMNAYLDKGTYFIRVTANGSFYHRDAKYRLTVNYTENKGEFEIEHNNDIKNATVIQKLNSPVTGNNRVYDDVDFYSFTLPYPGKVNIGFNHTNLENTSVFWKITVFDSNENEVLYYESRGTDTAGKSMNAYLDKGTYYIRIISNGSFYHSSADYKLTVEYTENIGEFEIEHNDTREKATLIHELNRPVTGNLRKYSDIDYYKFTLTDPCRVSLGFDHGNNESSSVFWKIALFDSNEKELLNFDSRGIDTRGRSNEIRLDKGTYYIRVIAHSSFYYDSRDYILTVISPDYKTPIRVLLNGRPIQFDQPPIIQNGRTLVPLRAIFEAMGATVEWDQATKTVTAMRGTDIVKMTVGNSVMTKNGEKITLDVPPQVVNNRTLVPARAVAESFGADVKWDGSTRTVIITLDVTK